MFKCRVCYQVLEETESQCPLCGFRETAVIGNPVLAEKVNRSNAESHRLRFLDEFDFGVTTYYWKDDNGTVAPDRTEWIPFGSGSSLLEKQTWLDQQFSRISDLDKMDLELEILRNRIGYRVMSVTVPVPRGALLQQVGIALTEDMKVSLLLKNDREQTRSAPVGFLKD